MKWPIVVSAVVFCLGCAALGAPVTQDERAQEVTVGAATGVRLRGVPDTSQPPENQLHLDSVENWCAPLAAANALSFLDDVAGKDWARGVAGGLDPLALSEYLGCFMATNGQGLPGSEYENPGIPGTMAQDIVSGIRQYAEWDGQAPMPEPLPSKASQSWDVAGLDCAQDVGVLWTCIQNILSAGVPVLLSFSYWNPEAASSLTLDEGGEIAFATWGPPTTSTEELRKEDGKTPVETWDLKRGIGHAVTVVGALKGDPDGDRGPLPETFWVIVHDNWVTTPEDVAVPLQNVCALVLFGGEPLLELLGEAATGVHR